MGQHFFFDMGNGGSLAFFWFPDAPEAVPGVASPQPKWGAGLTTGTAPGAALRELSEPDSGRAYDPDLHRAAALEIRRRALISPESWPDADSGRVRVGMSRCGVLAAMGVPSRSNPADDKWIYHRKGQNSLYVVRRPDTPDAIVFLKRRFVQ